jgi:hypothetical protein
MEIRVGLGIGLGGGRKKAKATTSAEANTKATANADPSPLKGVRDDSMNGGGTGGRNTRCHCGRAVNARPYTPPSSSLGPVGWGLPPGGSTVTAKAFAVVPAGTLVSSWVPVVPGVGVSTPALIGSPFVGTSQSW